MAGPSEQMHDAIPLSRFSFYLAGRESCVRCLGEEVLENLDYAFDEVIKHERLARAEMLFWFWVLGAYEIVRSMTYTSDCFVEHYVDLLKDLKKRLEFVRMPAAKMETRRKSVPVTSNRSPAGINQEGRDLLIGDPDNQLDSCRDLVRTFNKVIRQADSSTILKRHEDSERWRKDA